MKLTEAISTPRRLLRAAMPVTPPPPNKSSNNTGRPSASEPGGRAGMMRASLFRLSPLLALALLLGALLVFHAAPAGAQDSVLVSNIGQADLTGSTATSISFSDTHAQRFTTGSNPAGYVLGSIEMHLSGTTSTAQIAGLRAELWSNSVTSPDAKIVSLTAPSALTNGIATFTAPSNTALAASTHYFVVLYSTAGTSGRPSTTSSVGLDAGAASGWIIAGFSHYVTGVQDPAGATWTRHNVRKYRIRVNGSAVPASADADLSGLTASTSANASGTFSALTLSPSTFAAATTAYTATVANARTHVKITPTTSDSNATVEVGKGASLASVTSGSASAAIPLSLNANAIIVKVTAQDGTTTKTYTVTVTRQGAAPAAATNLVVAHDNRQLSLFWTAPLSTVTGYDVHYTSAAVGAVGNNAAATGSNPATAWVAVTRSGVAASQTITGLTNGTDYRVRVRAVNSVGNSAWVFGTGAPGALWEATLTVDQNGVNFGCDNSDANQDNCSSSTVLTEDQFRHGGTTYTVNGVYWQSDNDRFYFNIGNVTGQATKTALTSLTLNVDGIPLRINAATVDSGAIYWSYNPDTDWTDGRTVKLTLRSAAHQATAPSTDAALLDLRALRNTSASGTFSGLALSPSFAAATTAYTASGLYAVTHVKLILSTNHPQATVEVGLQGKTLTAVTSGESGPIALSVGANVITVKVTAQDPDFTKTYTVTVTRGQPSTNAALSGLTATQADSASGPFSALTLNPSFAAATTAYTASVPNSITYLKLRPTASDSTATVEVGKGSSLAAVTSGQPSGPISLSFGENAITVKVTAENGSTTNTYTVTVMRASAVPAGAPPTAATAIGTEGALVSNTGQAGTGVDFDNRVHGQGFMTGPYVDGYTLTGIEARFFINNALTSEDAATVRAELWSDSNGTPGTRVAYLSARNIPTGVTGNHTVTFTPSYGVPTTLAANTTYHFVIYTTGSLSSNTLQMDITRSMAEDAGAAEGWSIADQRSSISQNTPPWIPSWTTATNGSVQIAVKGQAVSISRWASTLTVQDLGPLAGAGCIGQEQCSARLSPNSFKYGPWMYNILAVTVRNGTLLFRLDREPPLHDDQVRLDIGGRQFQFRDASKNYGIARNEDSVLLIWSGTGLDWSDGDTVSVSLVGKNVPAPPTPAPHTDLHPVRVHYDEMRDGEPVDNFNNMRVASPNPSTIPGTSERRVQLRAYVPGTFGSIDPEKGIVTTTHTMLRVTAHPDSTLEWAIGDVYRVTGAFAAFANGGFTPAIALNPASKWTYVYIRVTNGSQTATHLVAIDPPPRTYTLTPQARVAEGEEEALTLSLGSPAGAGGVSFTVAADYPDGGATAEDVGEIATSVTVPEGQQSARIIIPTVDDEEVEAEERFTVRVAHVGEPAWAVDPAGTDTAVVTVVDNDEPPAPPEGPEPWDIRVVPGDGTLTVTWNVSSRDGVEDSEIWHVLRWSQESGVWANPRDSRAVSKSDGLSVDPGLTSYTITGLRNGVATGVFVRSMVGHRNNMSEREGNSSQWVRVKGEHTTPVAPPNAAPTVSSAIADATITNESGAHGIPLSGVFTDVNEDDLTITATSSDESVATVSVSADHSTLTVSAQARGTATVTVTADDGKGGSVEDSFTVTIKAAPVVASPIADVSGLEAGDSRTFSISGVFSDADGDAVTVTEASSSNSAIVAVSAAIDGSTAAITAITLTAKSEGTATITVTAEDADGNRVSGAFDVTVNAAAQQQQVNEPPTLSSAIADATIVSESGTHEASLAGVFYDADQDALTITASSSDDSVATSVSPDYSTLTVTAKARGAATITVTAADGKGGEVSDTFTVKVKAAPVVASAIADVSGLEVEATHKVSMSGVFSDADGDSLTVMATSSDEGKATVSVAADRSALTVSGVAEGTATITVTAQDADGNRASDAFQVEVVQVPEPEPDPVELPGPVLGLELTATHDSVSVSWSAPESGDAPDGYIVHIRPEGGAKGSGRTKTPKAKKTKVSFDSLEAGQTYKVWVRAENEAGKGERGHASITLTEAEPPPEEGEQQDGQSGQ